MKRASEVEQQKAAEMTTMSALGATKREIGDETRHGSQTCALGIKHGKKGLGYPHTTLQQGSWHRRQMHLQHKATKQL